MEIGFGHKFPQEEEIKEERLGAVKALGADGRELALKKISTTRYKPGKWLIIASHKTPYASPEECDENLYSASLTFTVR
ncbi:MAG: hypothetical protein HY790_14195 [Deltaproteobacteria bacterium]|nr:hypothetical protein [Deltaproteobacteria bacterium]MBI4796964.1 hypothetical protein [Deltaproteobacteria bacterium]